MRNVLEFLEPVGQDRQLRHLEPAVLANALTQAENDTGLHLAHADADRDLDEDEEEDLDEDDDLDDDDFDEDDDDDLDDDDDDDLDDADDDAED